MRHPGFEPRHTLSGPFEPDATGERQSAAASEPRGTGETDAASLKPNDFSVVRRRVFQGGVALGAVVFIALGWCLWRAAKERRVAKSWVEHTHDVVTQLGALEHALQVAEGAQRGYLVTGSQIYRSAYERAITEVSPTLQKIADLTRDNSLQVGRVAELRRRCELRRTQMDETARIRGAEGLPAAAAVVLTDRGRQTMDSIVKLVAEMRTEEERLLAQRRTDDASISNLLDEIIAILFVVAVALTAAVIWLVAYVRRLQMGLVTICAWTRQIRHEGEWIPIDEYLARRFGLRITHGISEAAARTMLAESRPKRNGKGGPA